MEKIHRRDLPFYPMKRLLKIPSFHPFTAYMEQLPEWDGEDRVTPLARWVSDGEPLPRIASFIGTSNRRMLAQVGKRVHTKHGNGYWVKCLRD